MHFPLVLLLLGSSARAEEPIAAAPSQSTARESEAEASAARDEAAKEEATAASEAAANAGREEEARAQQREQEDEEEGAVPETSEGIDEMVVLASGRDDFLKDMSISTTSFSAAEIKSLRIQNIADLADYTPNLEINTRSSASNPTLFIRGIGLKDYNANAASAVAVYQDGININSPAIQLGQLFDTENIAVLRGPQGSLNGRNATAGAIMITSVLPDGSLDSYASFTYGNYNNIQAEGGLSFPLVEDLLSTRFAFSANFRDGTTRNHCSNWDPESINQPRLDEPSIRAAYDYNVSIGTRFRNQFPRGNPNTVESDAQGRPLLPDSVCIWDYEGTLDLNQFDPNGDPVWVPNQNQANNSIADFQGLKRYVNNVDDWAARQIFRLTPDVDDGMDWVLNAHGGQNLSDSTRLQSLRTTFLLGQENEKPIFTEKIGEESEAIAALNSGLEGIRAVKGVYTSDSTFIDRTPGGRGGKNVYSGFYDRDGKEYLDTWGGSLRGTWDTGETDLLSLSGYESYRRKIEDEGDALPTAAFPAIYKDNAYQLSQELRASGDGDRYAWTVGAFILHEELDANNLFPGIRDRRIEQRFSQTLTSSAAYAGGRYWVLDEVYFDGGLRYNRERKKFSLQSIVNSLSGGQNVNIPEETTAKTWTGVTGDATLAWEPSSDWMYDVYVDFLNVYVKYGRGMKGGHYNAGLTILQPAGVVQRLQPVEPEFINSVESGFKSQWLQNRLELNAALFYYWYKDLQVFDFENEKGALPVQKLLNSDARVLGAEIEVLARPIEGLLMQLGVGWLDSEFRDFKVSKAINQPRGQGPLREFDYTGHPLISAPDWSVSGIVEYQIPLFHLGSLVPQYDFSYRGKVYLDPQKLHPIAQDPYWIHNARLAYRTPDGRVEIAGWVENFLDARYKIDVFDLSLDQNAMLEVWNDPRMYGVTISVYF